MYRIALVNMPFAAADLPSIALTQLKAVIAAEMDGEVHCQVHYPNLDFAASLGMPLYEVVSNSVEANTSGMGDWFFSQAAFPDQPDDPDAYLQRHFSEHRTQLQAFRAHLEASRRAAGAYLDTIIDRDRLDSYSLVGFTSMFSQNVANFALARRLKQRNPQITVVMGGANCEAPMGSVITRNVPWVDFVFSGPALRTFPRLVRHLLRGEADACHRIDGVLSRTKLASLTASAAREMGQELDISTPVPLDYDDYFTAFDLKLGPQAKVTPKVPFETSRGCWWGERSHCTFCGLNGLTMSYRAMPPDSALELLHGLFDRYAHRASEFQSVDNILPREYIVDVLPRLETPPGVSLFYEIKADLKDREMALLAEAQVTRIQPGIEALSTKTLKLMRKGTTAFQNIKFLKYCDRHGIQAFWNLLVGFPGEAEETYRKYLDDLPLLVHLQPPAGAFPVRFDRFSPYHARAQEYGLRLTPSEFYEMIYPFPKADFEDLAYFFRDADYKAPYLINTARWLGKLREQVAHWQTRWRQLDRGLKPQLSIRLTHGKRSLYDSRRGTVVEHQISVLGWRILDLLEDQMRLGHLAEKLGGLPEATVAAEVAALRQGGLLFEEDGLFLSLIVRSEAPGTSLRG